MPSSHRRRLLAAPLAALLLAGCAGGGGTGVISRVERDRYAVDMFESVLSSTPTVSVHGAPPDGASPQQVAAAMHSPASQGGRGFTLAEPGAGGQRVAVAFAETAPSALCAGNPGQDTAPAPMTVTVAFCDGASAPSSGLLKAAGIAGPSDPRFGDAIANVFVQMMRSKPHGGNGR